MWPFEAVEGLNLSAKNKFIFLKSRFPVKISPDGF